MGRVVKNARVNSQRYQVGVPRIESNGAHHDDEDLYFAPVAEAPAAPVMQEFVMPPPPVDTAAIAQHAHDLIATAETHAKALLDDAHTRAQAIIADASARAETLVVAAKASAHDDGYAEGTAAADREMSEMVATMKNLVDMARVERHKLMEEAEPELVRLAIGIAERVLHQQIALDRGVVVEMAKVAISRLVDRESVTVRVNPGDLERMREHRDEFLSGGDIKNFRVIEDQRVDRGGVVVETEGGTIDARISTQVNEAKRVLHIEDDVIVQPADVRDSDMRAVRAS
jgi:flagellar biosynthesis/type III secretory pathway protein FliH